MRKFVLHALLPVIGGLLGGTASGEHAAAVGVIGGADGPTQIIVTGGLSAAAVAVLIIVLIAGAFALHKMRKP